MSSSEDEFELNYVKMDSENEIKLLKTQDYAEEISMLFNSIMEYEKYKIAKKISKDIEKIIPDNSELFKHNVDFSKKFIKIINSDKRKNFNASVKRILSIDFDKQFIFNYTNIYDVCSILTLLFSECKKYKISSMDDLKNIIKTINLQRYDFYRLYLDYSKKKQRNTITSVNKVFSFDSGKIKGYNTPNGNDTDNKILERNIKNNYILNNDNYYYSNDEDQIKTINRRTFIYPEYNKIGNKDPALKETKLPIELIILLSKFKEVNCLIFQIQNIQKNYTDLAIFLLSNINWLFIKGIEEIKFDICNEDIHQGLDNAFNMITEDLYNKNNTNKSNFYYSGNFRARNINCWIPESDIFFEEKKMRKNDYIYKTQVTDDSVVIDDYICNVYNAFGNLMNIRYISQINFSIKNIFRNATVGQMLDSRSSSKCFDDLNHSSNLSSNSIDLLNESASIFDLDIQENKKNSKKNIKLNENNSQVIHDSEIPFPLVNINETYNEHFKMIMIYSFFLGKYLKNIKRLSLFFQDSFSYELYINYKTDLNSDLTHFLIFLNKIEFLQELNFSFNSLDDKSFEYILGMLYKNTCLSKLRMSFFTPDINYYDNALFNLCSSKKLEPNKLFNEFSEYQRQSRKNKEKKINEYILEEILLNPFMNNLCNLSNLLKLQLLKNLEELIFRFDIPLPLINNQKYKIVIIKFIINLFIMITFQQNRTKTFKILAPNLEINCNKIPFIRTFFNEISLSEEMKENVEINKTDIKSEVKKEEIGKQNINELNEEKNETPQNNNDNKEIIKNKSENNQEIYSQISQEYEKDPNKKMENYNETNEYDKSLIPKSSNEKAAIRNNFSEKNEETYVESRKLNPNDCLENLVIQLNICFLPEIFNFCKINNLSGLKYINLGNLDKISFKGFVEDYKLNCNKMKNLVTIKINLGFSVLFYDDLEKYIFDFINTNSPKLKEKLLLTNLRINDENKMKDLIELVYLKANIEKLVVKINYENIDLFAKLLSEFIIEYKNKNANIINYLVLLLNHPKYKYISNKEIYKNLFDFIIFSKNRSILCNEYS